MKITISYLPEYSAVAAAVIEFVRKLLPGAKLRSSVSKPPRKIVYITSKSGERPCSATEST